MHADTVNSSMCIYTDVCVCVFFHPSLAVYFFFFFLGVSKGTGAVVIECAFAVFLFCLFVSCQ